MTDLKSQDFPVLGSVREAGQAVHDMHLRITIDDGFQILQAEACIDGSPITGVCERVAPSYQALVGLNLFDDFRNAVKSRWGGVQGCSHLTELAMHLPTAALQTFAGDSIRKMDPRQKPFQLDRCHALDSHSDVVRRYLPRWYRAPENR